MGHSLQAVALLVNAASSVFAVPLAIRIHEGLVWSNRDQPGQRVEVNIVAVLIYPADI
jgi:hypothetical protein